MNQGPGAATAARASTSTLPRHHPAVVLLGWVAARALVAVTYAAVPFTGRSLAWGDLALYEFWARAIRETASMPDGVTWMYPPLAAYVLLAVDLLPGPFGTGWVVAMLALDLAVLALLLGAVARDRAHPAGAWAWVVLVPLLGLIGWARIDMLPVALAAGALLLASRRPVLAGALAGLGAAVKAWPVVLGLLFLRQRRWLLGAVVTGLGVAATSTLLLRDTWGFVANLSGRGVQVESVMALPWTARQAFGGAVSGDFVNGTYEVLEPGTGLVAGLAPVLMVAVLGLGWWRSRGRPPALRWYVLVSALLATSPLLSTQFVLWLVGGAAVAAALPGPDGALARRSLPVVAAVVLLSHATFPLQWGGLVGDGPLAAATLLARNLLLVQLTVWLLVVVGRSPSPGPASGRPHQRGTASPASSRDSR